ncbi:MAG: bifunctional phosphopantothenoylcysteine decarboxylase/phosphopantothenate--cysteine ligase CoaBC [Alphaproteobacteria bacterium]|nr:bifunctional phosphopantothenoylcysteine decarboxylase/phosphopantothenate--cysteine ligase CoaBC [Alphaproteobacteria bacterium]
MLEGKKILLIISGGIAAYKVLDLIRLVRKNGGDVTCIMTKAAENFITPLSVASLSQSKVYTDLWSLTDETEMGHIRLSRECDLVLVAPASADIIAKMAHGLANDLASTTLLASDKPIMIAPAMNPEMWEKPVTQDNILKLKNYGTLFIGPESGDMACGETGTGRLSEPETIFQSLCTFFSDKPLAKKKIIITAGPTYEPVDPVRFLGNRSSGKQGYAIAETLRDLGAEVTLISGPTHLHPPKNMITISVNTAEEMLEACKKALPADIAVCTAAVSDWRAKNPAAQKIKKTASKSQNTLILEENPDILKTISQLPRKKRPALVIGFAAETENLHKNAIKKFESKKCDWILANLVGKDISGKERAFGCDRSHIYFITQDKDTEDWSLLSKKETAQKLAKKIINYYNESK